MNIHQVKIVRVESLKTKFTLFTPIVHVEIKCGDERFTSDCMRVDNSVVTPGTQDKTTVLNVTGGKTLLVELWQDHRFGRKSELLGKAELDNAGFKGSLSLKSPQGDEVGLVTLIVEGDVAPIVIASLQSGFAASEMTPENQFQ